MNEALETLVLPSLEREIRRELTERAQDHAIGVFARNLRSLLLQPPLKDRRVLAIDPGFRTGCRVAALDESGRLLEDGLIHPHHPQRKLVEAKVKLESMIRRHQISVIAIGNGAACRDTEEIVANLIAELDARRPRRITAADSAARAARAGSSRASRNCSGGRTGRFAGASARGCGPATGGPRCRNGRATNRTARRGGSA